MPNQIQFGLEKNVGNFSGQKFQTNSSLPSLTPPPPPLAHLPCPSSCSQEGLEKYLQHKPEESESKTVSKCPALNSYLQHA